MVQKWCVAILNLFLRENFDIQRFFSSKVGMNPLMLLLTFHL